MQIFIFANVFVSLLYGDLICIFFTLTLTISCPLILILLLKGPEPSIETSALHY